MVVIRVTTTTKQTPPKSTTENRPRKNEVRALIFSPIQQRLFFPLFSSSAVFFVRSPKICVLVCSLKILKEEASSLLSRAYKINTNIMAELATQEVKLFGKWSFDDVEVRFSEIRARVCSRARGRAWDFRYFFLSNVGEREREMWRAFFLRPISRGEGKPARISMIMKMMRSKTGTVQIRVAWWYYFCIKTKRRRLLLFSRLLSSRLCAKFITRPSSFRSPGVLSLVISCVLTTKRLLSSSRTS